MRQCLPFSSSPSSLSFLNDAYIINIFLSPLPVGKGLNSLWIKHGKNNTDSDYICENLRTYYGSAKAPTYYKLAHSFSLSLSVIIYSKQFIPSMITWTASVFLNQAGKYALLCAYMYTHTFSPVTAPKCTVIALCIWRQRDVWEYMGSVSEEGKERLGGMQLGVFISTHFRFHSIWKRESVAKKTGIINKSFKYFSH